MDRLKVGGRANTSLFVLIVEASGFLMRRFLGSSSEAGIVEKIFLNEDYSRHYRRLLQAGSPTTAGASQIGNLLIAT